MTKYDIIRATEEEIQLITDKLTQFNHRQLPFTQHHNRIVLDHIIKDCNGVVIAGVKAYMYNWRVVFVEKLFVEEQYRGNGLGSVLLNKIEELGKSQGATLIHLDTFDFQAPTFYQNHGYIVFGVLEDCPAGHKRYYLKKKL